MTQSTNNTYLSRMSCFGNHSKITHKTSNHDIEKDEKTVETISNLGKKIRQSNPEQKELLSQAASANTQPKTNSRAAQTATLCNTYWQKHQYKYIAPLLIAFIIAVSLIAVPLLVLYPVSNQNISTLNATNVTEPAIDIQTNLPSTTVTPTAALRTSTLSEACQGYDSCYEAGHSLLNDANPKYHSFKRKVKQAIIYFESSVDTMEDEASSSAEALRIIYSTHAYGVKNLKKAAFWERKSCQLLCKRPEISCTDSLIKKCN